MFYFWIEIEKLKGNGKGNGYKKEVKA